MHRFNRNMKKTAAGEGSQFIGSGAKLLGILVAADLIAKGAALGYVAGQAGSPGVYDV